MSTRTLHRRLKGEGLSFQSVVKSTREELAGHYLRIRGSPARGSLTSSASRTVEKMIGKDDFGTIQAEKRAGLLLLGGNPVEDVRHLRDLRGVTATGLGTFLWPAYTLL